MNSLKSFHAIAASRGDGLLPELAALFERRAASMASRLVETPPPVRRESASFSELPNDSLRTSCPPAEPVLTLRDGPAGIRVDRRREA